MTTAGQAAARMATPSTVRDIGPRRSVLFFAFAFAVIADPVSSVAYAIEAALRALDGDLALLLPTMSLELVLFCAVAVFVSFLVGLIATARFARRERKAALAWVNGLAAAAVAFTLVVNLLRGWPVLSMVATLLIAGGLYLRWNRAGRPAGVEDVGVRAEAA
ncbi:hypothetical protein ACFYTG_08800 [Streptomyces mirabilis]|uniref:hypothetical protein n=1 Tax=Streptomyces mirabilis TaxID=68239 RepID=UPI0036A74D7C